MVSEIRLWTLATAVVLALLTACDTRNGGTTEHAEARGVVLKINGIEVVRLDSTVLTGQLGATANNALSDTIEVFLIADDADRDLFQPLDADESLRLTLSDTTFCRAFQNPAAKWSFHLIGKAAGTTGLKIQIYHLDHPDYTSPVDIPVVVSNP